jgi:hypothetical protein
MTRHDTLNLDGLNEIFADTDEADREFSEKTVDFKQI